jgi:hypothetical protein
MLCVCARFGMLILSSHFINVLFSLSTEADKLCMRLHQKLDTNIGHKIMLDHMPLLMVCLEGLGKLAKKFPGIAGTSISYLRDFLVDPSPILAKLHSQAVIQQKKDKEIAPYRIVGKKSYFTTLLSSLHFTIFNLFFLSSKSGASCNRRCRPEATRIDKVTSVGI